MTTRSASPRTSNAIPSLVLAGAVIGLAGCSPTITSLSATPNQVCPGSVVKLQWAASTGGVITASTGTAPGKVAKVGSADVVPAQTTKYRLDVGCLFGHAAQEVDVQTLDVPNTPRTLGQSMADETAGCDAEHFWVVVTAPDAFWDSHLEVGRVESHDKRPYHLEHAGRTGDISATEGTDAFAGQPVAGVWKLTTPPQGDEACKKKGPPSLQINVRAMCKPQ